MNRTVTYGTALLLDLVGAAGTLLIAARSWQTITTTRPAPLPADVLMVSGRTVDAAPTALALVALAGVVAVIATRGTARRLVGAVLVLAGAGVVWRASIGTAAIGASRARALVADRHRTVTEGGAAPHVAASATWPTLTIVCGVLVVVAGVLVVVRGHHWGALSARYDRPAGAAAKPETPTAPAMWSALDRGDDPTSGSAAAPAERPVEAPSGRAQEQLDTLGPEQAGSDSTGGRSGGHRAG